MSSSLPKISSQAKTHLREIMGSDPAAGDAVRICIHADEGRFQYVFAYDFAKPNDVSVPLGGGKRIIVDKDLAKPLRIDWTETGQYGSGFVITDRDGPLTCTCGAQITKGQQ